MNGFFMSTNKDDLSKLKKAIFFSRCRLLMGVSRDVSLIKKLRRDVSRLFLSRGDSVR
jgi:hypothetical protein